MIFTCNASRSAIYISWGHRNSSFFFSKIHKMIDSLAPDLHPLVNKLSKVIKKNLSLYVQEVPESRFARFLGIVFEESISQKYMF